MTTKQDTSIQSNVLVGEYNPFKVVLRFPEIYKSFKNSTSVIVRYKIISSK